MRYGIQSNGEGGGILAGMERVWRKKPITETRRGTGQLTMPISADEKLPGSIARDDNIHVTTPIVVPWHVWRCHLLLMRI